MPTDLNPISETSAVILPATGTADSVSAAVPFGVYTGSVAFCTGAAKQVDYVYRKLGGDVVDIELTADNVYSAYEEAVLEYSYIERYSYFSYEYLKSTVRDIHYISQGNEISAIAHNIYF